MRSKDEFEKVPFFLENEKKKCFKEFKNVSHKTNSNKFETASQKKTSTCYAVLAKHHITRHQETEV